MRVAGKPGKAEFRGRYRQWRYVGCVGEVGSTAEREASEERDERVEEEEWRR